MGVWKKAGGTGLLLLFFLSLVARSIRSNPAVTTALEEGIRSWGTLLALPLFFLTLLVVGARLRSLRTDTTRTEQGVSRDAWHQSNTDDDRSVEAARAGRKANPDLLGGQGGTRNRDFGIEEKPPDAALRDHLAHLRTELDRDGQIGADLDALETVVDEVEGERTIPPRCPADHCDAVWSERTIFRDDRGRYEVLDEGRRVRCLACERIVVLEPVGSKTTG